jgi:hypothetical protein
MVESAAVTPGKRAGNSGCPGVPVMATLWADADLAALAADYQRYIGAIAHPAAGDVPPPHCVGRKIAYRAISRIASAIAARRTGSAP